MGKTAGTPGPAWMVWEGGGNSSKSPTGPRETPGAEYPVYRNQKERPAFSAPGTAKGSEGRKTAGRAASAGEVEESAVERPFESGVMPGADTNPRGKVGVTASDATPVVPLAYSNITVSSSASSGA